jgi:hypothetical protein
VAIVLDRTPPEAVEEVAGHLARMLTARGLRDSPLFTVTEGKVDDDGLLPASYVADIRGWLDALADDADARGAVVKQTLEGAIRVLSAKTFQTAAVVEEQGKAVKQLREDADRAYDRALAAIHTATADGTLLRGEVLARWQEFVGTGELLKSLENKVGALRDRLVSAVKGKPAQVERVTHAVESGLEKLLLEHAENAAEQAAGYWASTAPGRTLLEAQERDLDRASREFRRAAETLVRDWQHGVLEMVRGEGADKRTTARYLAYGVNGLAVALMVVTFSATAGLTGTEAGIAGGSAVLGQKLLEAVFGDQAVRRLAERARKDLDRRVEELFATERARFTHVLDDLGVDPRSPELLRAAARRVDDLRFAAQSSLSSGSE